MKSFSILRTFFTVYLVLILTSCGSTAVPREDEVLHDFNQLIVKSTGGLVEAVGVDISQRQDKSKGVQVIYAEVTYAVNDQELDKLKHQTDMSAFKSGLRRPNFDRNIKTAESYDGKVERVTMIFRQGPDDEWNLVNYVVGYRY